MKYIREFDDNAQYEAFSGTSEFILPNISFANLEEKVWYNPMPPYLKFIAQSDATFTFTKTASDGDIQYSLDDGNTWTTDTAVTVNIGDEVKWRGNLTPSSSGIGTFSSTGNFSAQGNVMSLFYGSECRDKVDLSGKNYAFRNLFSGCTSLTNIDRLKLPATTLAQSCYRQMFRGCTSLTSIPSGFLPATTLENACYYGMFQGCTSLTSVPSDLLPAATLVNACYASMFAECSSLTTAPDLLADFLVINLCYGAMFSNCSSLNYIKCLATDFERGGSYPLMNWVNGVAANGTFVKSASSFDFGHGNNGIPEDWTVIEV